MSEYKEVLKKTKKDHNDVVMSEKQNSISKGVKIEQENKLTLDDNPNCEMSIHEFTLI